MAITITKPQLGGSENQWGSILNDALDDIVLEINSNADGTNTVTPNLGAGWEVGGVAVTSTAAELNILDGVTATAAELNILDGDTAAISTTVVDADRVVFNDAGTMKQVAMSDIKTYINAAAGSGSVTSVAMTVPTGLTVSGSPITSSGTLAVTLASGYTIPQTSQIPSTSDISNWNTAYSWGDHSTAGYATGTIPTNNNQLTNGAGYITGVPTTQGAIGTYIIGRPANTTQYTEGSTASSVYSVGENFNGTPRFTSGSWTNADSTTLQSGTWRCMTHAGESGGWGMCGLWVRIS